MFKLSAANTESFTNMRYTLSRTIKQVPNRQYQEFEIGENTDGSYAA